MDSTRLLLPALLALLLLPASLAMAEDDEGPRPQDVKTGAVHLTINAQYAKVELDGKPIAAEFENDGRKIVLSEVNRTVGHSIRILPTEPGLGEVTVKVKPKDFKLVKLDRRLRAWRAVKKARLPKAGKKKKKAKPAPAPEPDPQPVPDDEDDGD